jgi:hypothetical protein
MCQCLLIKAGKFAISEGHVEQAIMGASVAGFKVAHWLALEPTQYGVSLFHNFCKKAGLFWLGIALL